MLADQLIHLAIDLANILQMIWAEIRKWHNDQKLVMAGLAKPLDGWLDVLDQM